MQVYARHGMPWRLTMLLQGTVRRRHRDEMSRSSVQRLWRRRLLRLGIGPSNSAMRDEYERFDY